MKEYVAHPLTVEDCGPSRDSGDFYQNPEVALRLDESGVPVWWPSHREGRPLSSRKREQTFLRWLAGDLSVCSRATLEDSFCRRREIARHLLLTHSEYARDQELPREWLR